MDVMDGPNDFKYRILIPVRRLGPFHPRITLSCKILNFYLKLLLLLEAVNHNQSLIQHCPVTARVCRFPNVTSEAGSPFFYKLPDLATLGHMQHYQLHLADGDSTLPHWMTFMEQTSSLVGLALTEDCGIYHLKVSVNGERRAENFYLHIINRTVTDRDSERDTLFCSEGQMTIWAGLLLQLNPVTLNASQRIHLVSTMADYLRLPPGSVYLFSRGRSFIQLQEKPRVCRQGGFDSSNEDQDATVDAAELLWPVGCGGEERQSGLAKVLEHSVTTGGLARLLDAPVLGWRVLCASAVVRRKVKRDLQRLKLTPTPNMIVPPPTRLHQSWKLQLPRVHSPSLTKLETSETTWQNTVISVREEFLLEPSSTQSNYYSEKIFEFTSEGNALKTNHVQNIHMSSHSHFSLMEKTPLYPYSKDGDSLFITSKIILSPISVDLSCSLPNLFSAHSSQECIKQPGISGSKVKHHVEATGSKQVPETRAVSEYFWTVALSHLLFYPENTSAVGTLVGEPSSDTATSLSPSPSLHGIYPSLTQDSYSVTSALTHEAFDRKSLTTCLTPRPHPKETPLWTGAYRASRTDSESQPTVSSLEPTKDHHTSKPTLYNLPSVSHPPPAENPNDVLLPNSRFKTTQSPPASNKIPSTQFLPDVSPTSYVMTEQLSITQHFDTIQRLSSALNQDVTSPLNVTTQDVSSTTWMGQLTLSGQTELESSLTVSSMEPSVVAFTPALPSEVGSYTRQHETPSILESSEATSSSIIPLLQTFANSPDVGVPSLHNNLEREDIKSVSELCCDQKFTLQTLKSNILLISLQQSMPSMQQTLESESQQIGGFSNILVTGMVTNMYLNSAFPTTFTGSSIATSPAPFSVIKSTQLVPEDHFDPTAPSAVQDSYTTSFIHQLQTLDPSFPLCGQSVALDFGCTLKIKSTYLRSTVEHVLDTSLSVLKSYSQDEKLRTASQSPFLLFSPTQTSKPTARTSTETNQLTAVDISGTLRSLEDSGSSVVTYTSLAANTSALSIENSLFIRQTDSSGPITKGHPTQQILNTSLSPVYGTSTTLFTSLQAAGLSSCRRQSSVQPTASSASFSSSVNLPPTVLQSVPLLMATVGFPFHYSIPPKTFVDPEDGEADALSLEITLIDGPPISIGTWLTLDHVELHGVPLEVDRQFAPQRLLLSARDRQGLITWLPLTVDIRRSHVDPCHVFTLTAQRSLHSILRHRHRVELLLRKLSLFFNSSSNHHLSVVSMRPGSTVVSWYNISLCEIGRSKVRRCHVDQIQSMWLAMRSEDGSVKPSFRESMLPEFPVTQIGPVRYRQDCFPTTPTPAFNTTLTPSLGTSTMNASVSASPAITAASQQVGHYQWMAGMLAALLVVCLLILIVLLIAVVLHFCKARGRSRTLAIWPAGRVLSLQSRDLRAIRPRRPPLFQPELPPPPLRLWISLSQDDERPSRFGQRRKNTDKAFQTVPPKYVYL